MTILWADTETYSEINLPQTGLYRYAEDVEVLLFPYAFDDGAPRLWDLTTGEPMPADLKEALLDGDTIVVFHNAQFDITVLKSALNIDIPLERVEDTMVLALSHSLPGALGKLSDVFRFDADLAKDKRGRELINLFCKPRPKNSKLRRATRETHPEQWKDFCEYAKSDISAMRAIHKRLPRWNDTVRERELWRLDHRINARGFAVDTDLARAAVGAIAQAQSDLAADTRKATDGEVLAATQRDKLLKFILEGYGVRLPDLTASTIERRLNDENLPQGVKDLLAIRQEASKASTAKYKKLLKAVNSDGRLRGTLQFRGAARTGRWAGRTFQPQNLPRPSMPYSDIELGIKALKAGCADLVYPSVMQLTSSCIRSCIVPSPGKKLVVTDLSNIEGRVAAWLAGEDWKLKAFKDFDAGVGHDLYALAYARAFGITPEAVMENKKSGDGMQRQIGKVMELMLQYEGGVGAFLTGAAAYGIDLDALSAIVLPTVPEYVLAEANGAWRWALKEHRTYGLKQNTYVACDSLKRLWRCNHPAISSYWYLLRETVTQAILSPGSTFRARKLLIRKDGAWLRIYLPAGRSLCYASARAVDGRITYMGTDPYSRQWTRLSTYGGKIFENVCQAVAGDVLSNNMQPAEHAGYECLLTVHDELITESPDNDSYSAEELSDILATVPAWGDEHLPLAAGGFEAHRYRKD